MLAEKAYQAAVCIKSCRLLFYFTELEPSNGRSAPAGEERPGMDAEASEGARRERTGSPRQEG